MDGGRWEGEVKGSVTDSHLVPVARAARVVPLSAVTFDGLSPLQVLFKILTSRLQFKFTFSPREMIILGAIIVNFSSTSNKCEHVKCFKV